MEAIVYAVLALIYGACGVLCYRWGLSDGMQAKNGIKPILQPKERKKTPAELEQQKISEAVENFK